MSKTALVHTETYNLTPLHLKIFLGHNREKLDVLKERFSTVKFTVLNRGPEVGISVSCNSVDKFNSVCRAVSKQIYDASIIVSDINIKKKIKREREKRKKVQDKINTIKKDISDDLNQQREDERTGNSRKSNIPKITETSKTNMFYGLEIEDD